MYRNILVPISFDEGRNSKQAIEIAKLLETKGGKVTLLHVMEEVPGYAATYMPEGYIEDSRRGLQEELEAVDADIPGGQAKVISGHSSTTILEFAEKHGHDLIIIASHRPGMQDYFLGSTAHHVVRHAKCSVHVLR